MNSNRLTVHPMKSENAIKSLSNAEVKRLKAREHNRAYEAGEFNKPADLREVVRDVVSHAKQSLGI